jgi:hypothetical protein
MLVDRVFSAPRLDDRARASLQVRTTVAIHAARATAIGPSRSSREIDTLAKYPRVWAHAQTRPRTWRPPAACSRALCGSAYERERSQRDERSEKDANRQAREPLASPSRPRLTVAVRIGGGAYIGVAKHPVANHNQPTHEQSSVATRIAWEQLLPRVTLAWGLWMNRLLHRNPHRHLVPRRGETQSDPGHHQGTVGLSKPISRSRSPRSLKAPRPNRIAHTTPRSGMTPSISSTRSRPAGSCLMGDARPSQPSVDTGPR